MKFLNPRRQAEENVLKKAQDLDPDDHSPEAEQLRETAGDIQDHHDSQRWNSRGTTMADVRSGAEAMARVFSSLALSVKPKDEGQ